MDVRGKEPKHIKESIYEIKLGLIIFKITI